MTDRNPDFGFFWLAQAISRFGDPITLIALATVTYQRTQSALFTALAVVIATVPTAIFGFFAGAIGDALGHRRAMFLSDVARVALIGAVPVLLDLGAPLIAAYVCVFLAATFAAVFNPARIAIIPQLVPADRLAAANSTIASTDRTVEIVRTLCAHDARVRLIINTRNFGQVRSPAHALFQASGQAIIGIAAIEV